VTQLVSDETVFLEQLAPGLTTQEVRARQLAGLTNATALPTSRGYTRIFRDNIFTFINAVLFGLAIALIALGRTSDALMSVGIVAVNMIVGLVQEIHAKRVLDRIAVLTRPTVTVVRDGLPQTVDPGEVVVGDLLLATTGEQVAADGVAIGDRAADADESLLTGESRRVPKKNGDRVFAGTFCAAGTLEYVADRVGVESTANKVANSARAFRRVLTPLQQEINRVVRVSVVVVVVFETLVALANALDRTTLVEGVRMAVVIAGLIPNGLFLAIGAAYAMGAVRLVGNGALVQQANAVESLSHVDVLCLDKTGTLTTNGLTLARTFPLNGSDAEFRHLLGVYAASSSDSNRTILALRSALPAAATPRLCEVLFSSAHKWSGITLAEPDGQASYILGAPDVLWAHLGPAEKLPSEVQQWVASGTRVLLLVRSPDGLPWHFEVEPQLPEGLEPLGVVGMSDQLRPDAARTLRDFASVGVQLKLLSGDDPATVGAVAASAGMPCATHISGPELDGISGDDLRDIAVRETIFGRLGPDQKEKLIRALRAKGHYVAMIGDGINDVAALKASNLAIAMQTGTAAARSVSDLLLLQDNFAALPFALREGQRIRGGMRGILKLFLTRVLYMALLIVMLSVVDVGFPFAPKQNALVTLLTVGLPTLAHAAWAGPREPRQLTASIFEFVVPAACTLAFTALGVYIGYLFVGPLLGGQSPFEVLGSLQWRALARTAVTTVSIMCGILLILFVQPHGESISHWHDVDSKHAALALALAAAFGVIAFVPGLRAMFEMQAMHATDYLLLACVAGAWAFCLHWIWRWRLLDRLLGTTPSLA
jgi:cation-transporting ATPase E